MNTSNPDFLSFRRRDALMLCLNVRRRPGPTDRHGAQSAGGTANSPGSSARALSGNKDARLACFDRWAQQQSRPAASVPVAPPPLLGRKPPAPVNATLPATRLIRSPRRRLPRPAVLRPFPLLGAGARQRLRHLQLPRLPPANRCRSRRAAQRTGSPLRRHPATPATRHRLPASTRCASACRCAPRWRRGLLTPERPGAAAIRSGSATASSRTGSSSTAASRARSAPPTTSRR